MTDPCATCTGIAGDVHAIRTAVLGDPVHGIVGLGESHRAFVAESRVEREHLAGRVGQLEKDAAFIRRSIVGTVIPMVVLALIMAIAQLQGCL